ncbi:MAG: AI-2E family transporter [Methanoregulaceae archaeon]|nr:AI-2E family transporter [Methanoregulaceae archaeon]
MEIKSPRLDIFTIVVIFLILLTVFVIFFPLASPIILGMTLAVVLSPLHKWFSRRVNEKASAALVTMIAFLVSAGLLSVMVSMLLSGSGMLIDQISTIIAWLDTVAPHSLIPGSSAGNAIESIVSFLKLFLIPLLTNIPGMVFFAFIFFVSVFLFLLKGPVIAQEIRQALPAKLDTSIGKISGLTVNTLYAVYIVTVEVALLTFAIALPVFYLMGYPAYLQLAILAAISQFVPIIGPFIVMAFIVLFELASGDTNGVLIAIFIIYPLVLWLPGSYIRARLMGKRVAIHPLLLMIGIIGGISVMGIPGLIFGPFFIALLISAYKILIDQMMMAKALHENSKENSG